MWQSIVDKPGCYHINRWSGWNFIHADGPVSNPYPGIIRGPDTDESRCHPCQSLVQRCKISLLVFTNLHVYCGYCCCCFWFQSWLLIQEGQYYGHNKKSLGSLYRMSHEEHDFGSVNQALWQKRKYFCEAIFFFLFWMVLQFLHCTILMNCRYVDWINNTACQLYVSS